MAKDLLYYYNKPDKYVSGNYLVSPFVSYELGEIQSDFNMSQVIDGTKDSMKVQVLSFVDHPIAPYTIIHHDETDTWWIVSHDDIERKEHEGQPYWIHELELQGLIELLNARDLVGSGFNKDRYTFESFIKRLFEHSNLEFRNVVISTTSMFRNIVDLDQKVDYVKTFENYTLLSALREFLDGYNLSVKANIRFVAVGTRPRRTRVEFTLYIYPKTGNTNSVYDESIFSSVEEKQNMDKDSHGTIVVSNAQNVISTNAKTFPSVGAVKISGTEYEITPKNACIRLPSPVYQVNWVRMIDETSVPIYSVELNGTTYTGDFTIENISSKSSCWKLFQKILNRIRALEDLHVGGDHTKSNELASAFNEQTWFETVLNCNSILFYSDDWQYDPNIATGDNTDDPTDLFISPKGYNTNIPCFEATWGTEKYCVLGKKSLRDGVLGDYHVMYWENGSDLIKGFDIFIEQDTYGIGYNITTSSRMNIPQYYYNSNGLTIRRFDATLNFGFKTTSFIVNYIPMSDVKIKLDNSKDNFDTQYYNQSGKLTDSSALSKLLLSYSKEIESETITRYGVFYRYSAMPIVGSIVIIDDKPYVINNISYNFNQNEDESYVIFAEFTMSLYVATKSLMANPNTNIRDYAIPQTQNVRRVQLYKDYWDFTFVAEHTEEHYMPLAKYLNVNSDDICANVYQGGQSHIAFINVYDNDIGDYYYQLETTMFNMKKSVYEVLDFKDNNIIGYSPCNTRTGLDFSKLINDGVLVNTPVSYVNSVGELAEIYILFLNQDQFTNAWDTYKEDYALSGYPFENYSVIIDIDLWDLGVDSHDFAIDEEGYNKDATEVPVFEYVCELNDTPQVIVGNNILNFLDTDQEYYYGFMAVPKGSNNNNIDMSSLQDIQIATSPNYYRIDNAVIIEVFEGEIYFNFFDHMLSMDGDFYYTGCGTFESIDDIIDTDTQDLLIYRVAKTPQSYAESGYWKNTRKEIMFIISGQAIKDNEENYIGTDDMTDKNGTTVENCLYLWCSVNNYKL